MNRREMLPAAPLTVAAADKLVTPSTVSYALNVPATMSANAAVTIKVKSQQNRRNSFLPVLPMYCSIRSPIDLPSFLTLAYRAPKSVTAPKKMPPRMIQRKTGTHPKTAAWIAPVTGPAPAMDENWWANTTQPSVGT